MTERLIVLDAGHGGDALAGGSSPNHAIGPNGLMEKDVALDIALRLANLLRAYADVVLTRDGDRNLPLSARARIARDRRAAVFLSLHLGGDAGGVWISSHANPGSRTLAARVLRSLSGLTGVQHLYERNLGVLLRSRHDAATAACLAEFAPLHHPEQARRLEREDYRDRIASALAEAVHDHVRPLSQSLDDQHRHGPLPHREAMEALNRAALDAMGRWESVLTAAERRVALGLIPRLPRRAMELLDADREVYEAGGRAAAFKSHRQRMEPLTGPDLVWLFDTAQSAMAQIEDSAVRSRLIKQDWSKAVYVGKAGSTAPSVELFTEMARLTPERRVPSLIAYTNVESLVVKVPGTAYSLFPAARDAFVAGRTAANDTHAPGKTTGVALSIGSAFRSEAEQAKLAAGNPNRFAVASHSAHSYGLAIDLNLSVPGLAITEISTASMPNIVSMYRSPAYKWMFLYGAEFGWFPYRNEPWHWEYNPPGFPAQFPTLAKRP